MCLLREGIARLLIEAGLDVVALAGDAEELLRKGLAHRPAVVVADVNMPPGHEDDGLRGGDRGTTAAPRGPAVLALSQFFDERYALELIGDRAEGVGYPSQATEWRGPSRRSSTQIKRGRGRGHRA